MASSPVVRSIILCFCASFVASQGILFPDFNDDPESRCDVPSTGGLGWCRPIEDCPPMLELVKNRGKPLICGYDGHSPVVCCPVSADLLNGSNNSNPINLGTVSAPANLPSCGARDEISLSRFPGFSRTKRGLLPAPSKFKPHTVVTRAIVIVGGQDAVRDSWPWMALLGRYSSSEGTQFYCSAVLLNVRWLLTAAHCFKYGTPDMVRLGEHDYSNPLDGGLHTDYTVNRTVSYPDYSGSYHDLALIELDKDVIMRLGVLPVCLPWGDEALHDLLGESVTITGWGATAFGGENSPILQEAQVTVFPSERCNASYSVLPAYDVTWPQGISRDTFLCAGATEGGVDTCQGDSGGPFVYRSSNSSRFVLGGIVSKGYGCADKLFPGLYVPVAKPSYLSWIKDVAF